MGKSNTKERLESIMKEYNIRQSDILEKCKPFCIAYDVKMNKSDLSQYCSGKVEPSQKKLVILAKALDVSEAWLMGFDVPPRPIKTEIERIKDDKVERVMGYAEKILELKDEDAQLVMNLIDTLSKKKP